MVLPRGWELMGRRMGGLLLILLRGAVLVGRRRKCRGMRLLLLGWGM